jgi:two-component system response regulator NreC
MEVKVLIIDDHPSIIEGYKSILSYNPYGYTLTVQTALSCEQAYQLISTTTTDFDLVMIDRPRKYLSVCNRQWYWLSSF